QQLARVDGMQTATAALPDEPAADEPQNPDTLPSIEELMSSLNDMRERSAKPRSGHLAETRKEPSEEMLSPELVFPERYAPTARTAAAADAQIKCVLVLLDAEQPMKFPLYKTQMVIGRADSADIQIDSHFLSRQHARVTLTDAGVVIEDVESKNGVKINSKLTTRQILRHGDLLSLGGLCLRFLDTTADDSG
ncbi:MAG TPA: FHA domain-containing protein, partial [Vicinamibacterales bacterium]|nr:FHA domain-containing protein [Vicinamibacterales bacterium]